jgi:hypothetical protein
MNIDFSKISEFFEKHLITLIVLGFGFIFLIILSSLFVPYIFGWGNASATTLLYALSDTKIARGLITFLIAVSTVSIALLIAFYAICSSLEPNTAGNKNAEANLAKAKEVLAILIGVLGTIVGFYFGQATTAEQKPDTQASGLMVSYAKIAPDSAKQSEHYKITGRVKGGKPPYYYFVVVNNDSTDTSRTILDINEKIEKELTVPMEIPADSTIKAVIKVKDSDGKSVESKALKLRVKSGQTLSKTDAPAKGDLKQK